MPLINTARGGIWIERLPTERVPLLIHGAGGQQSDWGEPLRARGAAVDLPAHGNSPGAIRASVADYAADVIALLDALGLEQITVAGHSLGGAVALTLALDNAARVSGLILVSTGAKLTVHPDILDNIRRDPAGVAARLSDWFWTAEVDAALKRRKY